MDMGIHHQLFGSRGWLVVGLLAVYSYSVRKVHNRSIKTSAPFQR